MPLILDFEAQSQVNPLDERRRLHHEADVVIVGAGIAGCALAVALGNQGRSVILLEKSLEQPDRIVGELLQPGGVGALEVLGIRDCLDDIDAIPVYGYEVYYHFESVMVPYPTKELSETGEKPEGRSFHHGRFVQKLRAAAMRTPNVTVIESTVTDIVKDDWTGQALGVKSTTKGENDFFFAALTVVADGYDSKFRRLQSTSTPITKSSFYGIELMDAKLPCPYHGHVLLGDFSPVLLYQIGTNETRALIDVPKNCPAKIAAGGIKNYMRNVVLPILPHGVKASFAEALEGWKPRSMPNSWLPSKINHTPGMMIFGDAMNMRHPLTGGGMTVALTDVVLLSELLSPEVVPRLDDTKLVLKQLKAFHWKRKDVTAIINILAQALYSLFAANDKNLRALQRGCFRYFQLGGNCIHGPVGLLAGIIRNPLVLIYHFFAVALYGVWIEARSYNPLLTPFMLIWRGAIILYTACVVIFPYIGAELRG